MKLTEATDRNVPIDTATGVSGQYVGNQKDLVGKTSIEPDGIPDCLVRIQGLGKKRVIRSTRLIGPRDGVWLSSPNDDPRRWLLKTDWQKNQLILSFTYWAAGPHQLELTFDDGAKQSVAFRIPPANAPWFAADLDVAKSNVRVICKRGPQYTQVMTSCLKNILNSFPIADSTTATERR